ncbi:oligosaccharide flippase family protein [Celeribacter indicus]|uniref:Polysaccharide biosynthesis protein n=1 Tax=Celeribacter indicus TaxID=1208324 RepID=A0A0B5E405_9RHOB|nr:oligosaccharide flippase family protein [Celeribacter indicus]AJE47786.1 polysaccharide biosynthesis protein [Celeribacter indicus]SDW22825.1 Membrane protein involved in the export of O-antigen and teichoic acid [Celeribacter indicus]
MTTPMPPSSGLRGFLVSIGSLISARAFVAVSQLMVLPILARQITVEEFGLMGLAMTVVIFANTLSDGGLGRSLIRTRDADIVEWSSVSWVMVGVGLAFTLLICAISPLAARYFDSPAIVPILLVMSVVPLLQAVAAAPNAEIERREHYAGIARIEVASTLAGLAAAVIGALAGFGIWALVAQQILLAGVRTAGTLWMSQFRPVLAFSTASLRPHLIYARDTIAASVVTVARDQLPIVMISRVLGQIPLGYFTMSARFTRLPQFGLAGPMASVVYVRMSKAQHSPEKLRDLYYASMRLLSALLIPTCAVIAVASQPIFATFLSPEWKPTAPVFVLSVGGIVLESIAIYFLNPLFRAISRTDLVLRLTVEGVVLRLVLVFGAVFMGLEAVAASLTIWALIMVPRNWQIGARHVPITFAGCLATFVPSLISAGIFSGAYLTLNTLWQISDAMNMGLATVLGLSGVGLTLLIDHQRTRAALGAFRAEPAPAE